MFGEETFALLRTDSLPLRYSPPPPGISVPVNTSLETIRVNLTKSNVNRGREVGWWWWGWDPGRSFVQHEVILMLRPDKRESK